MLEAVRHKHTGRTFLRSEAVGVSFDLRTVGICVRITHTTRRALVYTLFEVSV